MFKKFFFLTLTVLATYCSNAQVILHIDVVPNNTPENDTLYFASNLNNWNPKDRKYAFAKDVLGIYYLEINDVSFPFEFKITRGSWENVETDESDEQVENRTVYTLDDIDTLRVKGWYDHLINEGNTISKNVNIISDNFKIPQLDRTRRIWIYLPESYHDSDEKYPVIYMHDGQNLFNNATSFAGEWRVDETIDSIIAVGGKKAIVVGIDNGGEDRIGELTPFPNKEYGGGDGHMYIDFIVKTLKPYIDEHFNTLTDRDNTFIVGSSLGGLISFYGIIKYKDVFSKAGILSPSFWFSNRIYFLPQYSEHYPIHLYFAAGDNESESMIPDIYKMIEKMQKLDYPKESYQFNINKGAKHNEIQWSKEFPDLYNWLLN